MILGSSYFHVYIYIYVHSVYTAIASFLCADRRVRARWQDWARRAPDLNSLGFGVECVLGFRVQGFGWSVCSVIFSLTACVLGLPWNCP